MSTGAETPKLRLAWLLFAVAALVRVAALLGEDAALHPDALYQGLEPAYEIVWGGADLPWEFQAGVRSWVWPAILAVPMWLTKTLGLAGPGLGMEFARWGAQCVCIGLELWSLMALLRICQRRMPEALTWTVGLAFAIHPAFAWPGSQTLIDIPATTALLWAVERGFADPARAGTVDGDGSGDAWSKGRGRHFGLAMACAAMLRVQLWPALLLLAAWVAHRARSQARLREALAATLPAFLGVVLLFGLVDAFTWGGAWSSLVEYLRFNLGEGGQAFGHMPADRYWAHFAFAFPGLRVALILLALWSARVEPRLLAVLLAFLIPHQLLEYRVWRFIHPALPLLWVCAALGLGALLERAGARLGERVTRLGALLAMVGVLASSTWALREQSLWRTSWLFDRGGMPAVEQARGLTRAYAQLARESAAVDLTNGVLPQGGAPGRAHLGWSSDALRVEHPVGRPPNVRGDIRAPRRIILDAQLPAATQAGWTLRWRDPESGVAIVDAP